MKTLFVIAINLFSTLTFAQTTSISSTAGTAQFQKVISLDSGTVESLYKKVNYWVAKTFVNPKEVLLASLPNEELRGQGYAAGGVRLNSIVPGDLKYTFIVEVKPSRVRITINTMVCVFAQTYNIETYVLKGDGTFRTNPQATNIIESATATANRLISSLEESLISNGKKDDW